MTRYDIINHCIHKFGYTRYLEIGTQAERCIVNVQALYKVGVEPYPVYHDNDNMTLFYQMTSDEFFSQNNEKFDIVFIDGLHHCDQVIRDIDNSLKVLDSNGTIVVHDCNPLTEESQVVPERHLPSWHGDVWRAWIYYRNREDLKMFVVDLATESCGVIRRGKQYNKINLSYDRITFQQMNSNRQRLLNLIKKADIDIWL